MHLPELKPLIGRTVDITVEEQLPVVRDEFWAEAARVPHTAEAFEAQKAVFRTWRADFRIEAYWPLLDQCWLDRLITFANGQPSRINCLSIITITTPYASKGANKKSAKTVEITSNLDRLVDTIK